MAGESDQLKWENKAIVEVARTSTESAWAVLEDFCNFHKWIPIDTCYQVEGTPGQPGLTRYCAAAIKDAQSDTPTIRWAKEKLLTIDPTQRSLSYEVVDSNMGFKYYVSTLKVIPVNGDDGCKIEWGFVCDPMEGWSFQDLKSHTESYLQFMANKIELASSAAA